MAGGTALITGERDFCHLAAARLSGVSTAQSRRPPLHRKSDAAHVQAVMKWLSPLRTECPHELFGIPHRRFICSLPFIYSFDHLFISVWIHAHSLHTLSDNPILLNFVAHTVPAPSIGSSVPLTPSPFLISVSSISRLFSTVRSRAAWPRPALSHSSQDGRCVVLLQSRASDWVGKLVGFFVT